MDDQAVETGSATALLTQRQLDNLYAYLCPSLRLALRPCRAVGEVLLFSFPFVVCEVYAGPFVFPFWLYALAAVAVVSYMAVCLLDTAREVQHRNAMRRALPVWEPRAIALYYRDLVQRGELREG